MTFLIETACDRLIGYQGVNGFAHCRHAEVFRGPSVTTLSGRLCVNGRVGGVDDGSFRF